MTHGNLLPSVASRKYPADIKVNKDGSIYPLHTYMPLASACFILVLSQTKQLRSGFYDQLHMYFGTFAKQRCYFLKLLMDS